MATKKSAVERLQNMAIWKELPDAVRKAVEQTAAYNLMTTHGSIGAICQEVEFVYDRETGTIELDVRLQLDSLEEGPFDDGGTYIDDETYCEKFWSEMPDNIREVTVDIAGKKFVAVA